MVIEIAFTAPMTFVAGNVLTAAQMNTHVRDNMKAVGGADKAACRVYNTTTQTIPTATLTTLTFNTERFDTQAMHSTVSNTSRITIATGWGGLYLFGAVVGWAVGSSNSRGIFILLNAGTILISGPSQLGEGVLASSMETTTLYSCVAGDFFELQVYQNSGGNLATQAGSSQLSPEFWGIWEGSG